MSSCDFCSAEPLNREELKQAGVFWLDKQNVDHRWASNNVFITRLHVRYTRDKFPQDLKFQTTAERTNFQGRYIIHHPYTGSLSCDGGKQYQELVKQRQEEEIYNLAQLTGWKAKQIRDRVKFKEAKPSYWWSDMWNN